MLDLNKLSKEIESFVYKKPDSYKESTTFDKTIENLNLILSFDSVFCGTYEKPVTLSGHFAFSYIGLRAVIAISDLNKILRIRYPRLERSFDFGSLSKSSVESDVVFSIPFDIEIESGAANQLYCSKTSRELDSYCENEILNYLLNSDHDFEVQELKENRNSEFTLDQQLGLSRLDPPPELDLEDQNWVSATDYAKALASAEVDDPGFEIYQRKLNSLTQDRARKTSFKSELQDWGVDQYGQKWRKLERLVYYFRPSIQEKNQRILSLING